MSDERTRPLIYRELKMSQVDALLQKHAAFSVVLEPSHARVLISLIENARAVSTGGDGRPNGLSKLFAAFRGALAGFRAAFFHPRLTALFRAIVYCSNTATWHARADGSVEFSFNGDAPAI
jgi:hypothetical protein